MFNKQTDSIYVTMFKNNNHINVKYIYCN